MTRPTNPPPVLTARASAGLFAGLLLLVFMVAGLGGLATADGVAAWYPNLNKPPWTPPNWAFGPVWTTLYTAMAVAMWDVARRAPRDRIAWGIWSGQLLLNLVWSPIFFWLRDVWVGLVVIGLLWVAIAACIAVFWGRSRVAAVLLIPYLLWVSIAASLNAWIAWFN